MPHQETHALSPTIVDRAYARLLRLFRRDPERLFLKEIAEFDNDDPEIYEMDRRAPGWNKKSMFGAEGDTADSGRIRELGSGKD